MPYSRYQINDLLPGLGNNNTGDIYVQMVIK